jgi:uncharacterized membrane protein YedE/YeeE
MVVALHLAAGLLFGVGLVVSDMIDPARVRAFLEVAGGAWDPTLAFVMGGALAPMALAWRVAARRPAAMTGDAFPSRPTGGVDGRLLGGAAVFGAGWGMVGFCPGPALAALGVGGWPTALFVAAMLAGMAAHDLPARLRPA